ncbi:Alpha-soluble NSF attachment protein [Plasmodiophora brassicae]|uniref:Alpha-soluble NSF attachment protein n=1 Tax=Plasmodiophora brassicae TaxID=37360 RepID=A0A0G4J6D9_PLABS|nr:hypothetical protein PBRA_002823 [Plasmodiophora brassicae]SPQ94962.1 unnamed protein product [Plasmodiophora brassicae]
MADRAADLVAQAKEKMKPKFFGLFKNTEEAAELFEKAAGQYKLAKQWKEAAETYVLAAEASKDAGDSTRTRNMYSEAGKAFKKSSPDDAIRMLKMAATQYQEASQLSGAAKLYKEIAEVCEEQSDLKGAIEAHQQSADCYAAEDQTTTANQELLQVANLSAQVEDYRRAIEIYEQVAAASVDNKLLHWSCKGYYFQAVLCHLALSVHGLDLSATNEAIKSYKDLYAAFADSRECKFCETIAEAVGAGDEEKFTDAVYEFDNVSRLDTWKTSILLNIKKSIKKAALGLQEPDLT